MSAGGEGGGALGRAELEALLGQHVTALRSYVRLRAGRRLREREPVSDLVQSTLREALEHGDDLTFASEEAFRRWVHGVAMRKIVSKGRFHGAAMRDAGRAEHLASRVNRVADTGRSSIAATPSAHAERSEDLARLQSALAELDEVDRELVCLRRLFDLNSPEIARAVGMPESTVRWRLARAMTQLAARLAAGR